ncbi:LysR substrate-binding domain-containing protein [Candidatus Paracaedibacter symbiosus]|uniref:LysR substrate-binding domain-containing protein n=1 Tax=Candidatus Paracaedibacter symbiosus TaxID=244582 RepID=UPI000509E516|nr:LysR substrate-binding domain-containing protein [Candidatus Paracaedibacter symbiosus]
MYQFGYDLDMSLLKTFLKVAETSSFTKAAHSVGRTQAAISLQIKRLEEIVGKSLLQRANKSVTLTAAGETMVTYARRMLNISQELKNRFDEPDIEGEVRLGTPEDFATAYLPQVLARFARSHPHTQLNVACDLTLHLQQGFDRGDYDMVLLKREAETMTAGVMVWHKPLVWVSGEAALEGNLILPLVLAPQPCVYRHRAFEVLDKAHRQWRVVYTSPSLAGTIAAVKAGLGVTVLPKDMVPEGLSVLGEDSGLPRLPHAEITLLLRDNLSKAAMMLAKHIIRSLESLSPNHIHNT